MLSFVEIKNEVPTPNSERVQNLDNPRNKKEDSSTNSVVKKIPRNAICPLCDSGKKYKRCCGKIVN